MTKLQFKAQLLVLNWLIGRCEDQMVRGWLIQERGLVERVGGIEETKPVRLEPKE